jgi:hypothetical protein
VVRLLVGAGADLSHLDFEGETVLTLALDNGGTSRPVPTHACLHLRAVPAFIHVRVRSNVPPFLFSLLNKSHIPRLSGAQSVLTW